jgi:oligopeptidase B
MATATDKPEKEHWQEVIPHRADVFLGDFEIFKGHLAIEERQRGLTQIRVIPWSGRGEHYLEFQEPTYRATIGNNPELETTVSRFDYTSKQESVFTSL